MAGNLAGTMLQETPGTSHAATQATGCLFEGPALVVFSGGTAFNSIAGAVWLLHLLVQAQSCCVQTRKKQHSAKP